MSEDHFTQEHEGKIGSIFTAEDARKAHHLASADPEPERDGLMTGPAHEAKYGLERAEASPAAWRARGVHPTENRALVGDEEGAENLRGAEPADGSILIRNDDTGEVQTTSAAAAPENTSAPRASDQ